MSNLANVIDNLYSVFADIPLPQHIEACPCCLNTKEISVLLETPLRLIHPNNLTPYAESAFLTLGGIPDYLYYLPRILEISALDDFCYPPIEVTGRAIASTNLQSWTIPRYNALTSLFHTVLEDAIKSENYYRIDSWICAIARMDIDVRPYLDQLDRTPLAVFKYFEKNANCVLKKDKLSNSFWQLPNKGHDAIVQWFKLNVLSDEGWEKYLSTFN